MLVASQLLRLAALYWGSAFGERVSIVLAAAGCVVLVAGPTVGRILVWVFAFLLLMVPFPERFHNAVSPTLQSWSSTCGQFSLELVGLFVVREGNVLRVDDASSVLVAEACSGLRLLTAFIFTGAVVAFLVDRPAWQRATLLMLTLPIAIVCNGMRVFASALVVRAGATNEFTNGFHAVAGVAMMPVALVLLFVALRILAMWTKPADRQTAAARHTATASGTDWRLLPATALGMGLLVLAGAGQRLADGRIDATLRQVAELRQPLSTLPLTVGDWLGEEAPLPEMMAAVQSFDDLFINRVYRRANSNGSISVFVGYVGRPRARLGHRPDVCYAAHGWTEMAEERHEARSASGQRVPCTLQRFSRPDEFGPVVLVLSAYLSNGRYVEEPSERRDWNSRSAALFGERPAYLTRVQIALPQGVDPAADVAALQDFLGLLADAVSGIMPWWAEERQ